MEGSSCLNELILVRDEKSNEHDEKSSKHRRNQLTQVT